MKYVQLMCTFLFVLKQYSMTMTFIFDANNRVSVLSLKQLAVIVKKLIRASLWPDTTVHRFLCQISAVSTFVSVLRFQ